MAYVNTAFKAGVVKDVSALVASTAYIDADKVRFRLGQPEMIGGWEQANATSETFTYPCRGAHAWASSASDKVIGFGTADKLYTLYGGSMTDRTPLKYWGTLVDPFTTVNGSSVVTVSHSSHGLSFDDAVTYSNADAVGGLTIDGAYTVVTVLSNDAYTIDAGSNASSSATGGGNVETTAALDVGLVDGVAGTGFGTGTYGSGYWGVPSGGNVDPRVWSCDNWGNNGIFVPRYGALYEWQPDPAYAEKVTTGDFSSSTGWTAGTGWTIGAGVATATAGTASDLSQDVTSILSGGIYYKLVVTVTCSAGSVQFRVTSADSGDVDFGNPIIKDGTYTRLFRAPSLPTTIKFHKDASFIGTIDDVSIKIVSTAYRIQSAPQYSIGGFVDPNRIVVLIGTVQADGTYNPMCVRWCAQENNTDWLPSDTNIAGESVLSSGSRCVGAMATRGQNLIFTDDSVYTMRFTGNSDAFSFSLAGTGCGLAGFNAAAEFNGVVFWWGSNNQFYMFRGATAEVLDCPLRNDVTDNLSTSQQEKIYCGVNTRNNEIWWFYPDARDGNECSRYLVYNPLENHWSCGTFERSAWIGGGVVQNPVGFGTDGNIYYHERGNTANGGQIEWSLQSGYMQLDAGNNFMAVRKYYPDFEAQTGNVKLTLYFRDYPNQTPRTVGPFTLTTSSADVNFRAVGREASIKWSYGANSQQMRLGVQTFDVEKTGMKR